MAKVKTWVWVVVGVIAVGILGIVAMAAAGLWFVRSHVNIQSTTAVASRASFRPSCLSASRCCAPPTS